MEYKYASNDLIYIELGKKVKSYRLAMNLTQAQLAAKAGLSKRAVERIESGENKTMDNFIMILRAFNLIENLDLLIPNQETRPTDIINKVPQKKRVRASVSKVSSDNSSVRIKWGDEE